MLTNAMASCDAAMFNVQPLAGCKRPLMAWLDAFSSHLVDIMTWDKGRAAPHISAGVMSARYEWLAIFSPKKNASRAVPMSSWKGKHSTVYSAPPQTDNDYAKIHGATFPVHLPEFIVGDLMNRSRGVVDCCCGTGTTIIAAEKLGKDGCGIELSPSYCDVIVTRWQKFTGQTATLRGDGRSFDEIAAERLPAAQAAE
jgi:DNA modification methylase